LNFFEGADVIEERKIIAFEGGISMYDTANTKKWRQTLGALGEQIAAAYLTAQGFQLLAQNYRAGRHGEVDLIASREAQGGGKKLIVFAEVKTRVSGGPVQYVEQTGQMAVNLRKQKKIVSTALHFLAQAREPASRVYLPQLAGARTLQFDLLLINYQLSRNQILALLFANDREMLSKHANVIHLAEAFGRFQ